MGAGTALPDRNAKRAPCPPSPSAMGLHTRPPKRQRRRVPTRSCAVCSDIGTRGHGAIACNGQGRARSPRLCPPYDAELTDHVGQGFAGAKVVAVNWMSVIALRLLA